MSKKRAPKLNATPPEPEPEMTPRQFLDDVADQRHLLLNKCFAELKSQHPEIKCEGVPERWQVLCTVSDPEGRWSKVTRAMRVGSDAIMNVTTIVTNPDGSIEIAEGLCLVPQSFIGPASGDRGPLAILKSDRT